MKTRQIVVCGIFAVILALAFTACPIDDDNGDTAPKEFVVDLSKLQAVTVVSVDSDGKAVIGDPTGETVRNKEPFTKKWDDLMLLFPEFSVDFTKYKRVTIRCKYFDANNVEIPQSNEKAMVSLIYDINGDIRGPEMGPGPNTPLKEFNVGGVSGVVSLDGGAGVNLTKAPGAILFQNTSEDVKFIVATEIVFHNRDASVLPEAPPPEDWLVADRWDRWTSGSTATIDHFSVGTYDSQADVCKVSVGGTAMPNNQTEGWNAWRTTVCYTYTAKSNIFYKFEFEAWTDSGDERTLHFQYYDDDALEIYRSYDLQLTSTRTTYTVIGEITKGGVRNLNFQLADQLGTVYVKILSITEHTPQLVYELIDDDWSDNYNTYRLVSAIGMSGAVEISATYNGKAVTEIGNWAFRECTGLTSVTIPASITVIDWGAFFKCTSLTSVNIPASVMFIYGNPFAECTSLTGITVDSGNPNFTCEGGILYNKNKTQLRTAPAGIGSVAIPASVTSIGEYAFEGCTGLTSITIPASITYVEWSAFQGWASSQTINIPFASLQAADNIWEWGWREGCNANIETSWTGTGSMDRIEYYWVDTQGIMVTTSGGVVTVAVSERLAITAQINNYYDSVWWYVDGVDIGWGDTTYNFSSARSGKYTVSLVVLKDDKLYNTNIVITVQ